MPVQAENVKPGAAPLHRLGPALRARVLAVLRGVWEVCVSPSFFTTPAQSCTRAHPARLLCTHAGAQGACCWQTARMNSSWPGQLIARLLAEPCGDDWALPGGRL